MNPFLQVALPAAFGAAIQELGFWWQLRFKLESAEYAKQMRSRAYWLIVALMIVGSAIGTAIWFSGEHVFAKDAMIFGAAFPLIFKHAVSIAAHARPRLGGPVSQLIDSDGLRMGADVPRPPVDSKGRGPIATYFNAV